MYIAIYPPVRPSATYAALVRWERVTELCERSGALGIIPGPGCQLLRPLVQI